MDPAAPPQRNLVAETEALIGGLVETLTVLLEPGFVRPRSILAYIARAVLLPAEAALRRLIHLIAGSLAPLPSPALAPSSAHPRADGGLAPQAATPPSTRPPLFRLTEPLPRAPDTDAPKKPKPETQAPRAPAGPSAYEATLQRRFAALQAAFADPLRAARRLQRLAARLAPAAPVLSLEDIPGLGSDLLTDGNRDTLERLNLAVTRQHAERLNSS